MANSKKWTTEKAHDYYIKNRDEIRIEKRRKYLASKAGTEVDKKKESKSEQEK